jgi:TFIIF-interacting CTD phosphatase-like protein
MKLKFQDLSILDQDLKDVLLVDDSPNSYKYQPDNAIPIETWEKEENDTQLRDLINLLAKLHSVDDVRLHNKDLNK